MFRGKFKSDNFRLGLAACSVVMVCGMASAQMQPGKNAGSGAVGDNPPTDVENPTPGGGAGPGKIEHSNVREMPDGRNHVRMCPADINGDGDVDVGDLFTFFDLLDHHDDRADLIGNMSFGFDDVLAFLEAWDAGC